MPEQKIIGITARKGVGKTTLATMLAEEIEGAEIVAFADELRYEARDMLNCLVDNISPSEAWHGSVDQGWLEDRKATIFGPLLQGLGEFRRQWNGEGYWIQALAEYIGDTPAAFIIPDVRHVNEAQWIIDRGGLLVALIGPSRWEGDTRSEDHPSERHVEECQALAQVEVHNTRGLDDLRQKAKFVADLCVR